MVNLNDPTAEEINILTDQKFLLLKDSIAPKVIQYLSVIERALKDEIGKSNFSYPPGTFIQSGKISKGENYRKLPYFVLDYPRLFTQKEVFAFRTMLWWGNQFSCTLHIGGALLKIVKEEKLQDLAKQKDLYFCIADTPWEYHFDETNYQLTSHMDATNMMEHMHKNNFLKISRYIPVDQWSRYKMFTLESFARLLSLLN
ncbi:MAG: hypothetical protein ACJA08_001194 [Cyclobacteriaceae bacterium]|jgi:hypothetical protein